MAKQMSVLMFGKYKGIQIETAPTHYLNWVFGSFPKLRNKLRGVLASRGLSPGLSEDRDRMKRLDGVNVSDLTRILCRYTGFIKGKVAEPHQTVEGLVVAPQNDSKLEWALSGLPNVRGFRYQVTFNLIKE